MNASESGRNKVNRLPGLAALTTLLLCGAATEAAEQRIEEMVVTAEKREASAQETAIAITALSGDDLDARGVYDVEALQFHVPSLVISPNSQSPVQYAYIRGVGTDQPVAGFDPGVAYHVDGVYIGQPSSIPGDLWDVERVEVLRGPQGTLYGKNTTGGSINVITAAPSDEFEAQIDGMFGSYERRQVRGAISGPLVEGTLTGRLSFIYDENDGFQKNGVGHNGDVIDHTSVRGKLNWTINEDIDLTLTAQRFDNEGDQDQRRQEPFVQPVYAGALPNPSDPRKVNKDFPNKLDLSNDFYSAKLTWDFGAARLVSITGYVNNNWFQQTDIDMSSNDIQFQQWQMDTEQFTQEIQLLSADDSALEWIVGAFYFTEDLTTDYQFQDKSPFGFHFHNGGDLESDSYAIFGQIGYDFRDNGGPFRMVGGLRYTHDKKKIDEFQQIPEFLLNLAASSDNDWSEITGKIEFDYFPVDDVMLYGSFSRGYKGGGFSIGQFDTYDPEKEDAFEVGAKTQFWDDRAQINISAFYNKYDDLQVNFLTVSVLTTDNAASATIQGIELESQFVPFDNFYVGITQSVLDAKYDKYIFAPPVGNTPAVDLKHDRLNRAPRHSTNIFGEYEIPLGDDGTLSLRAEYRWVDSMYFRVQNVARHRERSFDRIDLRVAWDSSDDQWHAETFITNAADNDTIRALFVSDGLSTGNNTFVSYHPPREFGIRFGWRTPK